MDKEKNIIPEIIPSDIYISLGLIIGGALLASQGFGTNNGAEMFIGVAIFTAGASGVVNLASGITTRE